MTKYSLSELGWNEWFESQPHPCGAENSIARVAAVDRDQLLLIGEFGFFRSKLSGKFLYESKSSVQRPCVGDWVCVEKPAHDQFGIVHSVLNRNTYLCRKAAGDSVEHQMIAANVDFVIIVQSCHYDFSLKRLERYLVMVKEGGSTPLILLTKIDLVTPQVITGQIDQIRSAGFTESVVTLSNVTQEGISNLKSILSPGKTYCFVGSSGVGKSTLINGLLGQDALATKDVSGTGEGRHTTVRRELILLGNGAMVIDNPGMREFGVFGAEAGIEASYSDILELSSRCRFRNCTHTNEPGCAVIGALERGEIGTEHYENFFKLKKESDYHQLSYTEKRRKDKDFGRFIKSVKKSIAD